MRRIFARRVSLFLLLLCGAIALVAPTCCYAAPASFASIPDYLGNGQFVQGSTISSNGRYAYVAKQNLSSACNVQRIDLVSKKSIRLSVSSAGTKAMSHANGLCCVNVGGTEYLLVAPSNQKRYLAVFVVSGSTLNYQGRISVAKKVLKNVSGVAVLSMSGNKVSALISSAGKLRKVSFNIKTRSAIKKGTVIKGFNGSTQSISVWRSGSATYVFAESGGWIGRSSAITKFKLSGKKVSRVWRKHVTGECQAVLPTAGSLYLVVEGSSLYNRHHDCVFSDRLVRWSN